MSTNAVDRFTSARGVADAVLYEGYVLYPYHASSQKNQLRWQFGVLAPSACCSPRGSDRSFCRTECVLASRGTTVLHIRIRFLHVQRRLIEEVDTDGEFRRVNALTIDGNHFVEWDEAVERDIDIVPLNIPLGRHYFEHDFTFHRSTEIEELHKRNGSIAGRILRCREDIKGRVRVTVAPHVEAKRPLYKVSVHVENTADWASEEHSEVARHSLVGLHTMLAVDGGTFISLLDPTTDCVEVAAQCRSEGAYPVLIGDDDIVLSSPIILYDHPEVAPESPGDLYDATEIDEILALRVLTMTDEEKAEARGTDPRSAAIIDRCDDMSPDAWERLHGTMRSFDAGGMPQFGSMPESTPSVPWWDPIADASVNPWSDSLTIGDTEVRKGSTVVLRPSHRSDAQDLFLAGLRATVAGVFKDVEGETHVAVTVDDDPANEELNWQGRYLFFHPDEVEPCASKATRP